MLGVGIVKHRSRLLPSLNGIKYDEKLYRFCEKVLFMTTNFISLEIENFKHYIGKPQIFDLQAYGNGLHFLCGKNLTNDRLGSNGAGKSSLWDAMCWCLYGRTVNKLRTSDIRPWTKSGPTWVTIDITIEDGPQILEHYQIKRGSGANQLTINDKMVGQEQVDNLIKLDYNLFIHAVILGQGRPLFLDLTPGDKMRLFSEVLDLDRWERRAAIARNEAAHCKQSIGRLEGEISGLTTALEYANDTLVDVRSASKRWNDEQQEYIEAYKARLNDYKKQLKPIEKKAASADLLSDSAGTELKALSKKLDNLADQLRDLEIERSSWKHNEIDANRASKRLISEMASLKQTKNCPTCGQTVKLTDLSDQRTRLKTEIKRLEKESITLTKKFDDTEKKYQELSIIVARQRKHRDKLQDEFDKQLAASRISMQAHESLLAKIRSIEERLTIAEEEVNPHRDAMSEARIQLKDIKTELNTVKANEKKLQAKTERAIFWSKGFGNIRLSIVDEVLTDLQFTTASLLAEVGLGDWNINYSVERETKSGTTQRSLGIDIQSPTSTRTVRWESWSGGEGQRLRLIVALAFADTLLNYAGAQINLRVLDEPTRGLSPEGVRDLCELLSNYADEHDASIWYVDHHSIESTHFTSVVTIVNDKDGAYVEVST